VKPKGAQGDRLRDMTPNSKRTLKQYIEDQVKREEQRIKKLEKLYEDAKQN